MLRDAYLSMNDMLKNGVRSAGIRGPELLDQRVILKTPLDKLEIAVEH